MKYSIFFVCTFYYFGISAQVEIQLENPSYEMSQIEVGQITILNATFLLHGDSDLQPSTINIQISCPYNSYTSSISKPPTGRDAHRFEWTLDENNYWNGINRMPIATNKEFIINLEVVGISPTDIPQTTDIHIRPIRNLELFTNNDTSDDYAQAELSVSPALNPLELITLYPENESSLVPVDEELFITFNEDISLLDGKIEIRHWDSHYLVESFDWNDPAVTVTGSTLIIDPVDFDYDSKYYILITSQSITSIESSKTFSGIHNPTVWSFSTSDFCSNNLPEGDLRCNRNLLIDQAVMLDNERIAEEALTITSNSRISGQGSVTYTGIERVTLNSGFKIDRNIVFKAQTINCDELPPTINTQVFLEGGLIITGTNNYTSEMKTVLYQSGLLPGMTPTIGFGRATIAGHPYKGEPWNVESCTGSDFTSQDYPANTTDWILVELRSKFSSNSTFCRKVAILLNDGTIHYPDGGLCDISPGQEAHIVIKHRNHLPIISPLLTADDNLQFVFDFRIQDSYRISPFDIGQLFLPNGVYAMAGANGDQTKIPTSQADIETNDKQVWLNNNSENDIYNIGDYDLNADVNSNDKFLWLKNNLTSCTLID